MVPLVGFGHKGNDCFQRREYGFFLSFGVPSQNFVKESAALRDLD
jgi:hypothetical protein